MATGSVTETLRRLRESEGERVGGTGGKGSTAPGAFGEHETFEDLIFNRQFTPRPRGPSEFAPSPSSEIGKLQEIVEAIPPSRGSSFDPLNPSFYDLLQQPVKRRSAPPSAPPSPLSPGGPSVADLPSAGGGGGLSTPAQLMLRTAGRAARIGAAFFRFVDVASPFMTAYDLVQTYLEPSDYERFRRRQALPRSTGAKRRPLARSRLPNPDVGVDVALDRRRGNVDLPSNTRGFLSNPLGLVGGLVGVQPSLRPLSLRNPRRDMPRRVATLSDPLSALSALSNPQRLTRQQPRRGTKNPFPIEEANRRVEDELKRLRGPGGGGPTTQPQPTTSAPAGTSPPPSPSTAKCPSSDPCMRRAADKRREQRAKQKKCPNPTIIDRKIRTCPPSNPK